MNILIVGCGRVGSNLAHLLDTPQNSVCVIDSDPTALATLGSDFQGLTVLGQGFDEGCLIEAGIKEADAFAAVTNSDNVNLMATEVARRLYDVPYVVTRLIDPERRDLYRQLGLDFLCDTELMAEGMLAKIRSGRAHHMDTVGDYELLSFGLHIDADVCYVRDIEDLGDIQVLLVEHDGDVVKPQPNTFLHSNDVITVMAHQDDLPWLDTYIKG